MELTEYGDLVAAVVTAACKIPHLKSLTIAGRMTVPRALALYVRRGDETEETSASFPVFLNQCGSQETLEWMVECGVREVWGPLVDETHEDEESESEEEQEPT